MESSTIYVSLEPCSHFGKTPPCSDLIVHHRFKRVVIGCVDTFSEVSGKGIEKLKNAGIEVTVGVLEKECRDLNKRFFTFNEKKRPYVILKWAQTPDGFIDKKRDRNIVGVNWITQPETKKIVHQWRAEEVAILVGKNTVLNDDPSLTVREVVGKNPIRIVLDNQLELPETAAIFSQEASSIIFNTIVNKQIENLEWIKVSEIIPETIFNELYLRNIQSVIIEGGKQVLQSFIASKLWDEARILIGTENFEYGLKAPEIDFNSAEEIQLDKDKLFLIKNSNN